MIISAVSLPVGALMVIPSKGFAVEAAVIDAPCPIEKVTAAELDPLKLELPKNVIDPDEQSTDSLVTFCDALIVRLLFVNVCENTFVAPIFIILKYFLNYCYMKKVK